MKEVPLRADRQGTGLETAPVELEEKERAAATG
jgi:hypothetical protein